jgi:hypothetical protein
LLLLSAQIRLYKLARADLKLEARQKRNFLAND